MSVVSADETNATLEQQALACEVVPESVERLPATPVTLAVSKAVQVLSRAPALAVVAGSSDDSSVKGTGPARLARAKPLYRLL